MWRGARGRPRIAGRASVEAAPRSSIDGHMDATDLAAARTILLAERARLLIDLGEAIVAPGQMTYGSQAAAASQVFAQQRDLALRDRTIAQSTLVDEALDRLEAGTFGTCVRCGKPIAAARLEALPWAATCIDCQRILDRGGR
jgi:RNA polymerase-binding protein DksA